MFLSHYRKPITPQELPVLPSQSPPGLSPGDYLFAVLAFFLTPLVSVPLSVSSGLVCRRCRAIASRG